MQRNQKAVNFHLDYLKKSRKKIAYHQAGRAVSVCLGNKQRQLPDVYFRIVKQYEPFVNSGKYSSQEERYGTKMEGGRLIQSLPLSFAQTTCFYSWPQQEELLCAFESDVINLLAGPLAEAKYLTLLDAEDFNIHTINFEALRFYGDKAELDLVNEYIESFILQETERERKLTELFAAAFNFINADLNWQAISLLAEFIVTESGNSISCEEAASLLESRLAA